MSEQPRKDARDTAARVQGSDTDDRYLEVLGRIAASTGAKVVEVFNRAAERKRRELPPAIAQLASPRSSDRLEHGGRGGSPTAVGALLTAAVSDSAPVPPRNAHPERANAERSTAAGTAPNRAKRRARAANSRQDHARRASLRQQWHPIPEQAADVASLPEGSRTGRPAAAEKLPPRLRKEVRHQSLQIARDGTGRRAREALMRLPWWQAAPLLGAMLVVAPFLSRVWSLSRAWISVRVGLLDVETLQSHEAREAVERVAASVWGRRLVQSAVAIWGHRQRDGRGVLRVRGFCQRALSWLVPKPDGQSWSRSALWRENGPFMLLAAEPVRPGRRSSKRGRGLGLYSREQPAAHRAAYVGPVRKVKRADGSTATEQWGLGEIRFRSVGKNASALDLALKGNAIGLAAVRLVAPWMLPSELREPHGGNADAGGARGDADGPPKDREAGAVWEQTRSAARVLSELRASARPPPPS